MPEKYQDFIRAEIDARIASNKNYSARAFARDAGISPSYLSQVLSNQRKLSTSKAWNLALKLRWNEDKRSRFLALLECAKSTDQTLVQTLQNLHPDKSKTEISHSIVNTEFELISSWLNFTLLELLSVPSQCKVAKNLAKTLKVSTIEVEIALKILARLGLAKLTPCGKFYERTHASYSVASGTIKANRAIKDYHYEQVQRLNSRFHSIPETSLRCENITIAIDSKRLSTFKTLIYECAKNLHSEMISEEPDEVYQLSMYFYPQI